MCGIIAFAGSPGIDPSLLEKMNGCHARRGPDGHATYVSPGGRIGLAHTRLAVIDLHDRAAQPMLTPEGGHALTFNGEIYNHKELRRELEVLGETFRTRSDTEVLLLALRRWGRDALRRVEGMFAFVLADLGSGTLLAARDRIGIKPLYVYRNGGQCCFSSTLTPLTLLPGFNGVIDPLARFEMLTAKYVSAPRSIYRQVAKVLPGTWMEVGPDGTVREGAYWSAGEWTGSDIAPGDEDGWRTALDEALSSALRRQMVADVPVGVFLSGGLDSALVASTACRMADKVEGFTIGVEAPGYDESHAAESVAAHLGIRHHVLRITPERIADALTRIATMYDEPFGDASAVPTALLCAFARQSVTVALTGDGGDEQFFGYSRYHLLARLRPWARLLPGPVRALARRLTPAPPHGRMAHAVHGVLGYPDATRLYTHFMLGHYAHLAALAGAGPADSLWDSGLHARNAAGSALAGGDFNNELMLADLHGYLPDDCLTKVDRASMAHSLEARVPLLDEAVLKLSLAMPPALKWRDGRGKHLLRRILHDRVPRALLDRPKQGFGIPLHEWLLGDLRDFTMDLLSRESVLDADLDPDGVAAIIRAHERGAGDFQYALWPLCCYIQWHRRQHAPPADQPCDHMGPAPANVL